MRVPILVLEALYSTWQESCQKDVERFFGILKMKFHVIRHGTNLMNMQNIIAGVYCCLMLHNMMVVERIHNGDDSIEDAAFYNIVVDNEVGETVPYNNDVIDQAAEFVHTQEENIAKRLLEVEYLEMLGICVHYSVLHDSVLHDGMERVSFLLL